MGTMTLAAMVASCGLGQRVLGLLSVAEDSGGSDIAFGIVFFCGIGLYDPCGSGGMDETEHARVGVHLGNDARVTHSAPFLGMFSLPRICNPRQLIIRICNPLTIIPYK